MFYELGNTKTMNIFKKILQYIKKKVKKDYKSIKDYKLNEKDIKIINFKENLNSKSLNDCIMALKNLGKEFSSLGNIINKPK